MQNKSPKSRFFSDTSFWNQPIAADPAIDPDSDRYVAELLAGEGTSPLHINMEKFTIPVYEVDASTPLRRVYQKREEPWAEARHPEILEMRHKLYNIHPNFGQEIPIPDGALPDADRDAHICIVDRERGIAWDMWNCRRRPDGDYETFCGIRYRIDGEGVWQTSEFPVENYDSIHYYGPSRAAGTPLLAGLIMHDEIQRGRIEHKIAFACWKNARCRFVFPACWTDGFGEFGLPEGAVLQLDPSLDLDDLDLKPAARTIARALQEYGMVDVDCARGNVIYAEGLYNHARKSWDGILGPSDLASIPLERFRVLKLENVVEQGDYPQLRLEKYKREGR